MKTRLIILFSLATLACGNATNNNEKLQKTTEEIINKKGNTLEKRINCPEGFERKTAELSSFAYYLRNLPLKPDGEKVKYFNGLNKYNEVYVAVVDLPISNKDLHQCADAVMRLRAEYLYAIKAYEKISFTLTNGFKVDYAEWINGNRIVVNGNKTTWKKTANASNTYKDFGSYLELIYTYAGTLSLSKSLKTKKINEISIGDVLIKGGSPGHAVIVVDMAVNKAGEKVFLLAQSYMPAQETQILKNPKNEKLSPWYKLSEIKNDIITPEWDFTVDQLKTW